MSFVEVATPDVLVAQGVSSKVAEDFFGSLAGETQKMVIYCDGACSGNGATTESPGGWGSVLIAGGRVFVAKDRSPNTTNNKMELTAAIESLKQLPIGAAVTLHTDSQYVIKGCTEWRKGWVRNKMRNSTNAPVKNPELWLALWAEVDQRTVLFRHVKGHAGIPGNEVADSLARAATCCT